MKFLNDPRLSQQEIDTLVAWIDAGAPKGDGAPPPLPAADQGWLHPGGAPPIWLFRCRLTTFQPLAKFPTFAF